MVRFQSTEIGLRLLQGALRIFLTTGRVSAILPGRIHRTTLGSIDPRELSLQAGFLRLVSVTEAAVDALAVELTTGSVSSIDETVRLLMLEKELAATSSWDARRRSFKRHHGVDLRTCSQHKRLEGAIEVRNAIAHGLGRLTTRQVISAETAARLARVHVAVINSYVRLESIHLRDCAAYSAEFLISLDGKLSRA